MLMGIYGGKSNLQFGWKGVNPLTHGGELSLTCGQRKGTIKLAKQRTRVFTCRLRVRVLKEKR